MIKPLILSAKVGIPTEIVSEVKDLLEKSGFLGNKIFFEDDAICIKNTVYPHSIDEEMLAKDLFRASVVETMTDLYVAAKAYANLKDDLEAFAL